MATRHLLSRSDQSRRPSAHIETKHPGHRVQFDNFYIGRLAGTAGVVWQYTACDVTSSYTWAELHVTPKNPSA